MPCQAYEARDPQTRRQLLYHAAEEVDGAPPAADRNATLHEAIGSRIATVQSLLGCHDSRPADQPIDMPEGRWVPLAGTAGASAPEHAEVIAS
jgi:hypothetical protein